MKIPTRPQIENQESTNAMPLSEQTLNKTEKIPSAVSKLRLIFNQNQDQRICVVGANCVGKSSLLKYLPEAVDMDDLLFGNKEKNIVPLLTPKEIDYACGLWTPEIGKFMIAKAHELIEIKPGHPAFGTIVFPSDLVIEITVPDNILRERIRSRNAIEESVFNMKQQIELEIEKSGIKTMIIENI